MTLIDRLTDSESLDKAADILDSSPELQLLGSDMSSRLRGLAALLRGEPTHSRGPRGRDD